MADILIQPNDVYMTLDLQMKKDKPEGKLEVKEDDEVNTQ